jgi:hypothetical protein
MYAVRQPPVAPRQWPSFKQIHLRPNKVKTLDASRLEALRFIAEYRPLRSARYPITSWPIKFKECRVSSGILQTKQNGPEAYWKRRTR